MLRNLLFCALMFAPAAAGAQDWATPDVCSISDAPVDYSVFDPPGWEALQAAATDVENGKGKFWRIEHPTGAVSHLWGTWHSSDPAILSLPASVEAEIRLSRYVALEIDFIAKSREAYRQARDEPNRFRAPSDPFDFANASDGRIAGLRPEISNWVRDRAIELGWTEDADLVLSPAGMAEMLLSDPCEDFASGILPIQDDYIQLVGRLAGAEIIGLEEPAQFLNDLSGNQSSAANAIIAVYAAYLKPTTSNAGRSATFQLYDQGQLGALAAWDAAYVNQVLGPRGKIDLALTDGYLLDFRNHRFIERLTDPLAKGGVFVAVGAGHLPGENGLVSLLRDRGFSVTRVVLPGEVE